MNPSVSVIITTYENPRALYTAPVYHVHHARAYSHEEGLRNGALFEANRAAVITATPFGLPDQT